MPPEVHLQLATNPSQGSAATPVAKSASLQKGEEVTIRARSQEKNGDMFKLRGEVQINFRTYILRADEITYDSATGDVVATGHVVLDGGPNDEHVEASHGTYNTETEQGTFYDVTGTIGTRYRGRHVILTTSNPFAFTGKIVVKDGPEHYVVHDGTVTSCEMPHPKWTFNARRVAVDVGGKAKIYNSTFRIRGVPVMYLPFADHPVHHMGRQSGFLIPVVAQSSQKGTVVGDAFYWAINRSMDAQLGAEYYSKRGWAQHAQFRAVPGQHSYLDFRYFGVSDNGFGAPKIKQGGQDIHLNGESLFGNGYRAVANIEYLSSFVFRLAFSEIFTQAIYSEVISNAFLSRNYQGYSFNSNVERYQNFQSQTAGDVTTIVHAPGLEVSSVDRPLQHSPFYWSFDTAIEGLSRSQPGFRTATLVGRFDLNPRVSWPILFHGWTLLPEIGARDTAYTQDLVPTGEVGVPGNSPINRRDFEGSFELRPPALSRIFTRPVLGQKLKHVVEPDVTYRYVHGIDDFSHILRFDARDIVSDTNEVEYGLTHRLFAKRLGATPCNPKCDLNALQAREIVTWRVAQKYYADPNFGGAVVNGRLNVLTPTVDFTGISFLDGPRHFSPVISRLRVHTTTHFDVGWDLDYDTQKGRINASTALLNFRFGDLFFGGSHALLKTPAEPVSTGTASSVTSQCTTTQATNTLSCPVIFSQYRITGGYGNPNRRGFNVATTLGVDANQNFIQYSAFQTTYNWDCCGLTFEYRRFSFPTIRNENQFRFALTLANMATFGNLRRQERLF